MSEPKKQELKSALRAVKDKIRFMSVTGYLEFFFERNSATSVMAGYKNTFPITD